MAVLHATIVGKCIADWWRSGKNDCGCLAELDQSGPDEVRRMAKDLSPTTWELRALAGKADSPDLLLYHRMADLGLDRGKIALAVPEVMREMQKLCSMCDSKTRCQRDLLRCADPSSAWRAYCPNEDVLHLLQVKPCQNHRRNQD